MDNGCANTWKALIEEKIGWVGCQSCGEPVQVWLPFVGCAFCAKCQKSSSTSYEASIGTEDFTVRYT